MTDLLAGVNVLDFTHVHAGPLCTYQLALMGATVTKVEAPGKGDQMRSMGAGDEPLMSPGFIGQSANKQSIALDLKSAQGLEVARRLVADADVIVNNMRPGTMDKLGLGVQAIQAINPKAIYCSISGYGQQGPYTNRPALDHLMQGESGMFDATGMAEGPAVRVGFAVADASTAVIASSAICAGLYRREHTGKGVFIDVSMLECCLTVMGLNAYGYLATGRVGPRVGPNPLARNGSVGTFTTKSNTLLVNGNNYGLFVRMATALGRRNLIESYNEDRYVQEWMSLRAEFAEIFVTETADHWENILADAGVPVGQVRNLSQVFENPQLEARRAITEIDGQRYLNAGFQVDGQPTAPLTPAQRLGAATRDVLSGAGYTDDEIAQLVQNGTVTSAV